MTTFRARMINFMLRNRHLFKGKRRKEKYDMNTSIVGFRRMCEEGATRYAKIPGGITIKKDIIAGLPAEWLIPEGAESGKVILYVHGGGYVSGSCNDHRAFVSKFAKNTGFTVLIYEYRLAPEFPFPAAVDDSVSVYNWLLENGYPTDKILVAGESAGGGLTLVLLLALKEKSLPMPKAAVSISPWADLTCSSDSYKTKNKVSLAPLDSWFVFSRHYAGNTPPAHPLISPLFGDLAGLPPLFINSGDADELYEDGEKFAAKASESGVDVTFRKGRNMVHCYPLLAPMFPEATEAMNEIVDFVKKRLN
ncbi:MAG: alpha/beta hydrolase [Syntrophothermus sp.]